MLGNIGGNIHVHVPPRCLARTWPRPPCLNPLFAAGGVVSRWSFARANPSPLRAVEAFAGRMSNNQPTSPITDVALGRRVMTRLTAEVMERLEAALQRPVARVRSPQALLWRSGAGGLEHLRVAPYYAPSEQDRRRPLIVRYSINSTWFDSFERVARRKGLLGSDDSCWDRTLLRFELSLLPEEVVGFVPLVVGVIRAHEANDPALIPEPPVRTRFWQDHPLEWSYGWSESAWELAEDYDRARSR